MLNKLTLLEISVSSNVPIKEAPPLPPVVIALIVVAVILAAAGICLFIFRDKIKAAIEEKKQSKIEASRQAELDRLHKIKKQNKRK